MDFRILNLLFRYSKDFNHKKIKNYGLNDTECMICSYIYSNTNCSQDDVSQALKIDKTTIAKALLNLEHKNHIMRSHSSEDKRKKILSLTETAINNLSEIINLHNNWFNKILSCLSEEEQKQFENYCIKLLHAAENLTTQEKQQ